MNIRKNLHLGQFTPEMPGKVNVGVCEMRKLSRALWDSFTRTVLTLSLGNTKKQRCFSPLPQHPIKVWLAFLICLFATKHRSGSVQLECWLQVRAMVPHSSSVPPHTSEVPHTPRSEAGHPLLPLHFSQGATLTKHGSRQ